MLIVYDIHLFKNNNKLTKQGLPLTILPLMIHS